MALGSLRGVPLILLTLVLGLSGVLEAQDRRSAGLRVAVGRSQIHRDDEGFSGGVHYVSRTTDEGLRFEIGLIGGNLFLGGDAGVELMVPLNTKLALLVRAGGGILAEDGFLGLYGRAGAGAEYLIHRRLTLRGTWQIGRHGGQSGPDLLHVGFDIRWP